jgi:glycosyltransferase involved in cell wall biosynthesis/2-polyprenyl-3-methyl-5-hydroxy-6-metoxy-1,4-benzoquinol methylase
MWPESSGLLPKVDAHQDVPGKLTSTPRILHLITTLDQGGTEQLVLTLARAQRDLGCRVEVAVLTRPGGAAAAFTAAGLTVHSLGLRSKLSPGAWWRLRRLLRSGDYDILHTHLDLADLYGPFAVTSGRPMVVSTRHNTDEWRRRRTWKRYPFLLWERAAQRRTAATLAVSAAVRDFLVKEEGLDQDLFTVVPNGIDLEPFAALPDRASAREDLKARLVAAGEALPAEAAGRPLILFAGRLAAQKGADILLAALASAAVKPHLVLCGSGPQEASLRHQAETLGLLGQVSFAGHQDDLQAIMPAFDLFVMPSRWEGFGLVAVEAMAAGLPVVASRCDGLAEVIADGTTGLLVPSGQVAPLAAALERALGRDAPVAAWAAAGRQRAQRMYSARTMAEGVLQSYRRAMEGSHGSADHDLDTLVLADRQVRSMWRGILPGRFLRWPPGKHLAVQAGEYAAVAEHLESHMPMAGRRLLDLGCGLGTLMTQAARRGAIVHGIEPDPNSLILCRHRLQAGKNGSAHLAAAVGESLPFSDASLDMVTCCSVLEHVQAPAAVLAEITRTLKPGGILFLGFPNALRFQERHYKVFLPPGTPRWLARWYLRLRGRDPAFLDTLHEMTPLRVRRLVEAAGLEIELDPIRQRQERLDQVLGGGATPSRPATRVAARLLRATGAGHLLRLLVARGFFVNGALIARRPSGTSSP